MKPLYTLLTSSNHITLCQEQMEKVLCISVYLFVCVLPGSECVITSLDDTEILCELPAEPTQASLVGECNLFSYILFHSILIDREVSWSILSLLWLVDFFFPPLQ